MPTAKYVYQDDVDDDTTMTDPDETRLESQEIIMDITTQANASAQDDNTTTVLSTPLPLRGGGSSTHHFQSVSTFSRSMKTNKSKHGDKKYSDSDDDDDDEMMRERQFLDNLAKRQREQQERIQRESLEYSRRRSVSGSIMNPSTTNNDTLGGSLMNVSRRYEESLCTTQDTVPMNNRTIDVTRDATLLGDTVIGEDVMEFEEQSWEQEVKRDSMMDVGNTASTTDQPSRLPHPKTPKPCFSKSHHGGWETKALLSSLTDLLSRSSESSPLCSDVARKRCFDAVSRSLARLAVASRSYNETSSKSGGGGDGESIPSPRSLPSFMSVMNVEGWNSHTSSAHGRSETVFEGRSAHGRSARVVCLNSEEGHDLENLMMEAIRVAGNMCKARDGTVEAALEFLATAFACLECDFVYSMLLLAVGADGTTLFDVLLGLAPKEEREGGVSSTLAFLALSRGLEAAIFVARYATSLDPAGCCAAYASPHSIIGTGDDHKIDEGGVGFLSALGKDLGLHLEDDQGVRLGRLNDISKYAIDSIMDFNPMISDGTPSFYDHPIQSRGRDTRGGQNESLCIDTDVGNADEFQCRNPSVVKDRMYAAHVEFLSSMIQMGIVSGWLSTYDSEKTVEKLCQKLFLVIETRSRLRRSTNQRTTNDAIGDSEAVCSASLSLLLLSLPKHREQSTSNSISFRQMGETTGTISDVFESPLVKSLVELGLSSGCDETGHTELPSMRRHALNSSLFVISDLVIAGGASLIAETFREKLNLFIAGAIRRICQMNQQTKDESSASIDAALLLILHLHNSCPVVVRRALRNIFDQSSGDDSENCIDITIFVGNLLQLCAHPSFSISVCASALFRSLLQGNPFDGTPDVLSDLMRHSLESDYGSSVVDDVFHSLIENIHSFNDRNLTRQIPRICSIGDALSVCLPSSHLLVGVLSSTLQSSFKSKSVGHIFVDMVNDFSRNHFDTAGTSLLSAVLSIVYLLSQITSANHSSHDVDLLATLKSIGLLVVECALAQGSSADVTHRALKYQKLFSVDEKTLALAFTRTRSSFKSEGNSLRNRITDTEREIRELRNQVKTKDAKQAKLQSALTNQSVSYEKKLDLVRFEAQSFAKVSAEIHVQERQRAEQCALKYEHLYAEEKERRRTTEVQNRRIIDESQQLKHELSQANSSILQLKQALQQETKEKEFYVATLESSKNELNETMKDLEKSRDAKSEIESKLKHSEKTVHDLTAVRKDLEVTIEETCEKLVGLATIYQRKEVEMDRYKAELRSAVNAANKNCDTAISKYEAQRKETKSLKKELESTKAELYDLKEHKADVQRLRKNAPTSYINQLRNDPRVQPRKSRSGKENSYR